MFADPRVEYITPRWPRRKPGVCWSCLSDKPVRVREYITVPLRKPLCASCERDLGQYLATAAVRDVR